MRRSLDGRLPWALLLILLPACNDPAGLPSQPKPSQTFVTVVAGDEGPCVLTGDHRTFCWHRGSTYSIDPVPREVATPESLVALAGGVGPTGHFCGQGATGSVYCWGALLEWDLGYSIGDGVTPLKIGDGFLVGSIAVGSGHACALASDSTARCWGTYIAGKRGVAGPYPSMSGPSWSLADFTVNPVTGDERFVKLVAGREHTCGIRSDATVACWGDSAATGAPNNTYRHEEDTCWLIAACTEVPVMPAGLTGVYAISAGGAHTCAIGSSGVRCWGPNLSGQVDPSLQRSPTAPIPVDLPLTPVLITAGVEHSCAVNAGGEGYCWGNNRFGQFGSGSIGADHTQGRIRFAGRFTQLSAGSGHTCGIDTKGWLYCWGSVFDPPNTTPWSGTLPVRLRLPD